MSRWIRPISPGRSDGHARLLHDREGERVVERALLDDVVPQVRPQDVLHRDEPHAVDRPEGVDVDDVGVVELGDRRGLGLEPAEVGRLSEEVGAEYLEGDRAGSG